VAFLFCEKAGKAGTRVVRMDWIALLLGAIALFLARRARGAIAGLETRIAGLAAEVAALRGHGPPAAVAQPAQPEPGPAEPEEEEPAEAPTEPEPAAEATGTAAPPPAGPTAVPQVAPAAPASPTLEEMLGTRWAVWVGGLALALGGILLVRYSIEQGIFGPGVRVALGGLFALVLVGLGEWFRRSGTASAGALQAIPTAHIPSILTAAGTASAFGTVYAAHALYGFIGPAAAFLLLGVIGVATMLAAALHGPALAGLGLAGSLVVPMLVSSEAPSPWPLVIYLAVVAGAAYVLARLRRWLWLAVAVVAGAIVWGLPMLGPAGLATGDWASALFVHVAVQLVLAAAFVAIEPHLATPDDAATPDWIATLVLAALAALAILALGAARFDAQWGLFAAAAMGVLALTAWRSAPAAAAAALAGTIALGGISVWPGLKEAPEPRLLAPAVAEVLRLPENVTSFLGFAAISTLAIAALAALRLWRGRTLPVATAGLYALAAIVPPLLALVLAYLRVTQFDRSIPFALSAAALAAVFYVVADRFDNVDAAAKTDATRLGTSTFAAGVAAAMTLAFVMVLERGYLTVAFAVTALTTAFFAVADRIVLLRYVVAALGFIVLGRLAWDPRIMGADVGTWPVLNWLLVGYGVPSIAFLAAGHVLRREREDLASRISDALGVLFAALLFFFQIRHALNGGDPLANTSGHVEQGLFALMSLGFAYVLMRIDLGRANTVFRFASLAFGVLSGFFALFGLGLVENPLLNSEPVRGAPVFSSLLLAYLLPGLAALVLARGARGVRPGWYVTGAAVLALLLVFGYVTLEVRHAFQGPVLSLWRPTSPAEVWAYSAAWLGLGILFLGYGLVRGSTEARLASAALVFATVIKVFAYDLTGIGGMWRALSVICLGAVLIGIGLVYQRFVFARTAPPSGTAAVPPGT
jgi:uncharacterized membrane protein